MIKYQLICDLSHEFEGWFQASAAFDAQNQSGLISCPVCGSANVRRALMTPNLASPKRRRTRSSNNNSNTDASFTETSGALSSPPFNKVKSSELRHVAPNTSPGLHEIGVAITQLRQLQRKIKAEFRDVGTEFAAEARKIHYGKSAPENIYGQSSDEEREALADEGIDVVTMPWLPPEH